MHLIRYSQDGQAHYGYLEGQAVGPVTGDVFGEFVRGPEPVAQLDEVTLLAPCQPGKIVAVTYNFGERLRELDLPAPDLPPILFKAPSAVIGPGEPIRLPPQAQTVQAGVELAVVIGRPARWVSLDEAGAYILGYTCANHLLAVDIAELDQAWTRAGSFDTFCPLGPSIATQVNPAELMLTCRINGVTRQMSSTRDLLFSPAQVLAFVSAAMSLLPGDVILMGSPAGTSALADGDEVEVSIEQIGALTNPVVREAGT